MFNLKSRIYLTLAIVIVLVMATNIAEARIREGYTWTKKNHNKWAYIYNELPMKERHKHLSALVLIGVKDSDCAVTKSRFKGISDGRGIAVWIVQCSKGNSYVIMILPDGTTRVATCESFYRITGSSCF